MLIIPHDKKKISTLVTVCSQSILKTDHPEYIFCSHSDGPAQNMQDEHKTAHPPVGVNFRDQPAVLIFCVFFICCSLITHCPGAYYFPAFCRVFHELSWHYMDDGRMLRRPCIMLKPF